MSAGWRCCLRSGRRVFSSGRFPATRNWWGGSADAVTFFIGSILFTAGGAVQTLLAFPERHGHASPSGRSAWWAAVIQSAGTVFFNVTTYRALQTSLSTPRYDRLVWGPDVLGSICFLVSGAIVYRAAPR
ncbi:MAG: hypothetical protein ACXV5Q_11575, partial [Frankiaceae bacterium]